MKKLAESRELKKPLGETKIAGKFDRSPSRNKTRKRACKRGSQRACIYLFQSCLFLYRQSQRQTIYIYIYIPCIRRALGRLNDDWKHFNKSLSSWFEDYAPAAASKPLF